jgi:hypothetical protein
MLRAERGRPMSAPGWLGWALAVLTVAVAGYHLGRLAASRISRTPLRPDVEVTHAAMSITMTMMLLGPLAPLAARCLALIFAVPMMWFACSGVHTYVMDGPTHRAGLVAGPAVACAIMIVMLAALAHPASASTMAGRSMPDPPSGLVSVSPELRSVLVVATVAVAGWTVARVRTAARALGARPTVARVGTGCQLVVSATTVYMLLSM